MDDPQSTAQTSAFPMLGNVQIPWNFVCRSGNEFSLIRKKAGALTPLQRHRLLSRKTSKPNPTTPPKCWLEIKGRGRELRGKVRHTKENI